MAGAELLCVTTVTTEEAASEEISDEASEDTSTEYLNRRFNGFSRRGGLQR